MAWLRERVVDSALLASVIVAGAILLHGAAHGENDSCTNNSCQNIMAYTTCSNGRGNVFQVADCLMCVNNGRCAVSANLGSCNATNNPQGLAITTVNDTCDCSNNPGGLYVEAWSNYSGDYIGSSVNQKLCSGGSGG